MENIGMVVENEERSSFPQKQLPRNKVQALRSKKLHRFFP